MSFEVWSKSPLLKDACRPREPTRAEVLQEMHEEAERSEER
jgi:hypothetical protein